MKDKRIPDRSGELYEDAFTENESKPRGAVREEVEETERLDPDVDSQEDDELLAENAFGVNDPNAPYPPRERAQAVYGDTDIDPNRDDQKSAHQAGEDEHL